MHLHLGGGTACRYHATGFPSPRQVGYVNGFEVSGADDPYVDGTYTPTAWWLENPRVAQGPGRRHEAEGLRSSPIYSNGAYALLLMAQEQQRSGQPPESQQGGYACRGACLFWVFLPKARLGDGFLARSMVQSNAPAPICRAPLWLA